MSTAFVVMGDLDLVRLRRAFGHVVEGMDVVNSILTAPTSPTKGEGVMKGQMLDPVVKITKASRLPNEAALVAPLR